jgi:hypothetical protein
MTIRTHISADEHNPHAHPQRHPRSAQAPYELAYGMTHQHGNGFRPVEIRYRKYRILVVFTTTVSRVYHRILSMPPVPTPVPVVLA